MIWNNAMMSFSIGGLKKKMKNLNSANRIDRRLQKMPNEKGWCTKEEVLETGLPYYIPASSRWTEEPYDYAILLTKSRCKEFGTPILSNGLERPSAFRYAAAAGTGTSDKKSRYFPLYDRTSVFEKEISKSKLYEHEIMGKEPTE